MSLVNDPLPREQATERSGERRRLRWLLLAMAFASLTLAAVFGRHGLLDVQRYRAERDRLRAEISDMEARQRALEAEVAAVRRDPSALERVAREELSLARKGEVVILLEPAPAPAGAPEGAP